MPEVIGNLPMPLLSKVGTVTYLYYILNTWGFNSTVVFKVAMIVQLLLLDFDAEASDGPVNLVSTCGREMML
jgi:hypothetical protein